MKRLVVVARLREYHEHEKEVRKVRRHKHRSRQPSMEVVRKKVVGAWDRREMEVSFLPV